LSCLFFVDYDQLLILIVDIIVVHEEGGEGYVNYGEKRCFAGKRNQ